MRELAIKVSFFGIWFMLMRNIGSAGGGRNPSFQPADTFTSGQISLSRAQQMDSPFLASFVHAFRSGCGRNASSPKQIIRKLASLLVISLATHAGCEGPSNEYVPPPPPDVTVTTAVQRPVTDFIEANGETEAAERAVVRSRVRGFIEAIDFEPGQVVERDRLLYKIGDEEYVAAVNSATAELAAAAAQIAVQQSNVLVAQAEANRSEREWERQSTLMDQQATSKTEFDQALSAKETATALLAAAKSAVELAEANQQRANANLDKARLDLGYTSVVAPISGRISRTDVKLGNLVENGADLTEITDSERVFVNFTISDRQVLEFQKVREREGLEPLTREQWSLIPIFARRETDDGFPFSGTLDYVAQTGIDVTTGTLAMRGVFDNSRRALAPGLFVRVRMPLATRPAALLIPARAVVRDRGAAFLLIVDDENRVQRREVRLGRQDQGWLIVEEGLQPGERLVLEGLQRARPGGVVNPIEKLATDADLPAEFRDQPSQPEPSQPETSQPEPSESGEASS
ncbi:MAG: efflux RND transporter periplasmic adaptor subunit [Planctomycetaceae bacterium]|nr:MAG: efflux RND transporter periplasmic adaptor subunit [Planctomycetaceae bacterium]